MTVGDIIDQLKAQGFDVSDRAELQAQILAGELDLAEQAADYAKSISPEETGDYRNNINIHQNGESVWVGFDDEAANIVEYGSVDTPEFAIRAKTEEHFNE